MDRAAWAELVAAHTALESLHSAADDFLPQLLDALAEAAAGQPIPPARVTAWRTAAAELLREHATVLGDLERMIAAAEPPEEA